VLSCTQSKRFLTLQPLCLRGEYNLILAQGVEDDFEEGEEIPPFIVMDVLEKAQELARMGEDIIHLKSGSRFRHTGVHQGGLFPGIREGETHYTHSLGLIELREAIAEDYWKNIM